VWLAFDCVVADLCSPPQNNPIDCESRVHLSFQSIDDSAPAGLGGATSSRYKAHVKEYNRAYGICEALEELLMGFSVMCLAHSDSWRLMWKKKMQEVSRASNTLDTSHGAGRKAGGSEAGDWMEGGVGGREATGVAVSGRKGKGAMRGQTLRVDTAGASSDEVALR